MENNKKSVGRYFLVFEPKYESHQFAVYFDEEDKAHVKKIRKYTDLPFNEKTKVKKNTLGQIDKITTNLANENEFFEKYIDKEVFNPRLDNLHKMFIGYVRNDRVYSLGCVFGNNSLSSKQKYVSGNNISDFSGIGDMVKLVLDDKDKKFLKFMNKSKKEHETNLSGDTVDCINELKVCHDLHMNSDKNTLDTELRRKLTSYKEYREMHLLISRYQGYLASLKQELMQDKEILLAKSNELKKEEQKNEVEITGKRAKQLTFIDPTCPNYYLNQK